jgi:hypothetical protein
MDPEDQNELDVLKFTPSNYKKLRILVNRCNAGNITGTLMLPGDFEEEYFANKQQKFVWKYGGKKSGDKMTVSELRSAEQSSFHVCAVLLDEAKESWRPTFAKLSLNLPMKQAFRIEEVAVKYLGFSLFDSMTEPLVLDNASHLEKPDFSKMDQDSYLTLSNGITVWIDDHSSPKQQLLQRDFINRTRGTDYDPSANPDDCLIFDRWEGSSDPDPIPATKEQRKHEPHFRYLYKLEMRARKRAGK